MLGKIILGFAGVMVSSACVGYFMSEYTEMKINQPQDVDDFCDELVEEEEYPTAITMEDHADNLEYKDRYTVCTENEILDLLDDEDMEPLVYKDGVLLDGEGEEVEDEDLLKIVESVNDKTMYIRDMESEEIYEVTEE